MKQMIVIKTKSIELPKGVVLKKEAMEIFNNFKCHAFIQEKERGDLTSCLCLKPFNDSDSIYRILDEGMYEYHSNNPYAKDFISILEELVDSARAITFTEDDILAFLDC